MKNALLLGLAVLFLAGVGRAADPVPTEDDYYKITRFEIPKDVVLEPGALELTPEKRLLVSSRRGEIWSIENPFANDLVKDAKGPGLPMDYTRYWVWRIRMAGCMRPSAVRFPS